MSEHTRQSSPRVTPVSPAGRPSPLSRPHWPWSTYTHQSPSSPSTHSASNSLTSRPWSPSASSNTAMLTTSTSVMRRNSVGPRIVFGHTGPEETTRHWSFTAFEWVVRDVHKLRDFIEGNVGDTLEVPGELEPEVEDFEVLKESPMLGDGKFKLEITKTAPVESSPDTVLRDQPQTLSLYITSLLVDFAHADYEMAATLFTAIKCQDDRVGERGARTEWAWEFWQNDWVFRQESEVWECPLPPLSSLLENPRIKETDSFVICVQIHSPVGPFFPQQPSAYYVPRELLDGLEALLDNPNTGDVQFVCLERMDPQLHQQSESTPTSPGTARASSRRSSSSSQISFSSQTVARKRIIYAHSDILTHRSEYFMTMLASSFSENTSSVLAPGDRKIFTVVSEEADFVTVYWLLKWVYANWLLFKEDDDPRAAVDGVGVGWSAKGLGAPGDPDEWGWKTFSKGDASSPGIISDTRSVASVESALSRGSGSSTDKGKQPYTGGPSQGSTPAMRSTNSATPRVATSKPGLHASTSTSTSRPPNARRSGQSSTGPTAGLSVPMNAHTTASPTHAKSVPIPLSPTSSKYGVAPHYPISPHAQRQRSHRDAATADPHPHPIVAPPPASALSMYQVAHRYAMPGLASLALEHILSTLTPQSSFAVLLATAAWDDLHTLVEDYVVEKWDEVSVSAEFEQCCQEVAGGEWGVEGGKTLTALFRRLRSPNAMIDTRSQGA